MRARPFATAGAASMTTRLKAPERKATIVAAARWLFAEKGFHGVSVDDIVQRVGVSPAVLYRHFVSKDALYEAVLNEIAGTREDYVGAVLGGAADFGGVLRRMTQVYVDSVARYPDYLRMEMHAVLEGSQAATRFFDNRWKSFTDYVEYGLRELRAEGRIGPVNERAASLLFQGMLREALYAKCIYHAERYRDLGLPALVHALLGLFFRAVGYREENQAPPDS